MDKKVILLSIHPTHIEKILNGEKRFEFRRKIPVGVTDIVIYATAPVCAIVAIATVEDLLAVKPASLWPKVAGAAGISKTFFNEYFAGRDIGFAIKLGRITPLSKPVKLSHPALKLSPPQSFCYMPYDTLRWLLDSANSVISSGIEKIFVGGVHGAGKSFISNEVISVFGYHSVTASQLIKKSKGNVNCNKLTKHVQDNQKLLLRGLEKESSRHTHLAIDGHFCLINSEGKVEELPIKVFKAINPRLIVLVQPPIEIVKQRLSERSSTLMMKCSLSSFISREMKHATAVSKALDIPLVVIDSSQPQRILFSIVKKILHKLHEEDTIRVKLVSEKSND